MNTITEVEREAAIQLLESRKQMLLAAVAVLGAEQWRFRPGPERWCILEIAEHLIAVETAVMTLMPRALSSEPVTATLESNDIHLQTRVVGRMNKVQATERVRPTGRWQKEEELIAAYCATRDKTIAYARDTQDDLRHHAGPHPALGVMDCYQWLLFLAAHTERHIKQIRENLIAANQRE